MAAQAALTARHLAGALILAGVLLHSFAHGILATHFHAGFWLWSLAPYLLVAALRAWRMSARSAACALIMPLMADIYVFHSVFIAPASSTAALGLVAMPLWNLLLLIPVGLLCVWLWVKFSRHS